MNIQQQYQYQGIQWLYEMELLNHPQLINNIKMNVMITSTKIKEVELVMSRPHKSILIWIDVDLGWIRHDVRFKEIETHILDIMTQLLPSYKFRVIKDKSIMNLAITKLNTSLKGVNNENSNNTNIIVTDNNLRKSKLQESSNILPNSKKLDSISK